MPKAERFFRFDKEKWIRERNISNRKFVFLDTFAWSEIIRGDKQVFRTLKETLAKSVEDKKIIVGISFSLVIETRERSDTQQAKSILELFDILSDGVYLISHHILFSKELEEQIVSRLEGRPVRKLSPDVVFGPMAEILSSFSIGRKENANSDVDIEIVQAFSEAVAEFKLMDFSEIWLNRSDGFKKAMLDYLEERYQQSIPQMEYSDILEEEQFWLGRHYVPFINKVYESVWCKVVYEDLGSQELYREILSQVKQLVASCPIISVGTEINARLRLHKDMHQSLKLNDFYDVLHLESAIPYCDYVLCDKAMSHLCGNELKLGMKYQTKILSFNEIDDLIAEIIAI